MLRDIIGQRQEPGDNGKPARTKSAVAAFESVDSPSLDNIVDSSLGAEFPAALESGGNHFASDARLKGTIQCASDLFLGGEVEGDVKVDGHLLVGESARIKGEVQAKSIAVCGQIVGNVTVVERCELRDSAMVKGDISARSLSIEEGASFFGQSAVGALQEASASRKD